MSRYDTLKDTWAIETSLTRDLFRFSGCTYVNSTFEAIYLFGGQSTYDNVTQSYHIQNSTLLYVPLSVAIQNYGRHVHHNLNSGQIAGIVVGVTVGVILGVVALGFFIGGYYYYRHYVRLEDPPTESKSSDPPAAESKNFAKV